MMPPTEIDPNGVPVSQSYAHIYLSPHSDDAVLSCGGQIYQQAQRKQHPLVITLFSGSPPDTTFSSFAQEQHHKWEMEEDSAMAQRRSEDRAALEVLEADAIYLDYLDCIYRLHPVTGVPMYASEEGIFGELDQAEAEFHLELADRVAQVVGSPRSSITLYAPLTAGHHVDHQLMRKAAIELAARGHVVAFYEDYPYAQQPEAVDAALSLWSDSSELAPCLTGIGELALQARISAMAEYTSQIQTLFGNLASMEKRVRAHCAELAGDSGHAERYWVSR